jgi:hypothetical protein
VLLAVGLAAQEGTVADRSDGSVPVIDSGATAAVLRLIRFSGSVPGAQGQAHAGAAGVTFALYADQEGGSPLWLETQNVALDAQGRYTALLGSTQSEGLPLELFTSREARWLGIQVQGQPEQPRILLVSVPYALRAEEAQRLAGREASEFLLAEQLESDVQQVVETKVLEEMEAQGLVSSEEGVTPAIVDGASTFTDNNATQVVLVTQNGTGKGLKAVSTTGNAVDAESTGTSGTNFTLRGINRSTGGRALFGFASATTGNTIAAAGRADSTSGIGFFGQALATSGVTAGVQAEVRSPNGTAGVFANTAGGRLLEGRSQGQEVFTVAGANNTGTNAFTVRAIHSGAGVVDPTLLNAPPAAIRGDATTTSDSAVGVLGVSAGADGVGVVGGNTATTGEAIGVIGLTSSTSGVGVLGEADAATGTTIGVEGTVESSSDFAVGVFGEAVAASGQTRGVVGRTESSSDLAIGVVGNAAATSGLTFGVSGVNSSTSDFATGVSGAAFGTSGITRGVSGLTDSTSDFAAGVSGWARGTSGNVFGVVGQTDSAGGQSTGGSNVFSVNGSGDAFFNGGLDVDGTGDSDFAGGLLVDTNTLVVDASNNRVGIGIASPLDALHVASEIRVTDCVKNSSGTQIAGSCVSDVRFKRDIEPFGPSLEKVVQLTPAHFSWRADEYPERGYDDARSYGLIAQEVEEILPELVTEGEDGYKKVNYSKLPLLLLQAVRELKTEKDSLQAQLEELSREIARVKAQLNRSEENQVATALRLQE